MDRESTSRERVERACRRWEQRENVTREAAAIDREQGVERRRVRAGEDVEERATVCRGCA